MDSHPAVKHRAKPRVLIADDSRIVRAMLIKHIEPMYDFQEAHDGEDAWEALLSDPTIRVVITDLTMPRLDGYGLLQRIRSSSVRRIQTMPVVVVSGSDGAEARTRAISAGATDLITKGIDTAQLLSRLDVLSKMLGTRSESGREPNELANDATETASHPSSENAIFYGQAAALLENAKKSRKNFVVLIIRMRMALSQGGMGDPSQGFSAKKADAMKQLLQRAIRQSDRIAKTGEAEFTLITGSINFDSARLFAQRIFDAITSAQAKDPQDRFTFTNCGVASLGEGVDLSSMTFHQIAAVARKRALMGHHRATSGIIGKEEELAIEQGLTMPPEPEPLERKTGVPDLSVLVQWSQSGLGNDMIPPRGGLSTELSPFADSVLQRPAE